MTVTETPIPPSERLVTLDVLRGFALFGILVVNWTLDWQPDSEPWHVTGTANVVTSWFVWLVASSKFWNIFSFLFAAGFVLQIDRLRSRNAKVVSIYSRRLIVLFLIGAANLIFGPADVVYIYAMLGFMLLLMEKQPPTKSLPFLAITVMLLLWAYDVWTDWETTIPQADVIAESTVWGGEISERLWNEWQRARQSGTFLEVTAVKAEMFWTWSLRRWGTFLGFIPIFLIGLYAGRRRIFFNIAENRLFFRHVTWWAFSVGIITSILSTAIYGATDTSYITKNMADLLLQVSSTALSFFYIGGITLLLEDPKWLKRLQPLAIVGRMALTNYLLHSVAFVLLFYGYGLGLVGKIGAFGAFMMTLPFFLIQVILSSYWLKRFRFGPAEWFWRTLTYGKPQPMRLAS